MFVLANPLPHPRRTSYAAVPARRIREFARGLDLSRLLHCEMRRIADQGATPDSAHTPRHANTSQDWSPALTGDEPISL